MRCFKILPLVLFLTGCLDANITLNFAPDGTVEIKEVTTMTGELAALANQGDGCAGGTKAFANNAYSCTRVRTVAIDAFVDDSQTIGFGPNGEGPMLTAQKIDDETVRVTFTFDETGGIAQQAGIGPLVQGALEDHKLVFRVKGYKIIETTGQKMAERPVARRVIPLSEIVKDQPDFGGPFSTLVQFAPKCWLFGLICD